MLVHFLMFIIFGIANVFSLQCYTCLSEEPRDACVKLDKHKIPLQTCGLEALEITEKYVKQIDNEMGKLYEVHAAQEPQFPLNCLKQVIQYGDRHYTLRGCQLATSNHLDICVKVKNEAKDLLKTNYCSLCSGDGCNKSSKRSLSLLTIFIFVIIIFY